MYYEKKFVLGFLFGAAIATLLMGVWVDALKRENQTAIECMVQSNQEAHFWRNENEKIADQRDILSDVIRWHSDECHDSIIKEADEALQDVGCSKYDLQNWAYCY